MWSPEGVVPFARASRGDFGPVVVDIGMCVSVLIQGARMVTVVVRLRQLMFQQHQVRRIGPTGSHPDPRLRDIRVCIVAPMNDFAVVVPNRMFLAEQVILDLLNVLCRKVTTILAWMIGQDPGHVVNIAIITAEAFIRVISPLECREIIARPDHTAGIGIWGDVGNTVARRVVDRVRVPRIHGALGAGGVQGGRNANRNRLLRAIASSANRIRSIG